jgi:multidrug/hemolysin transport system permease protein
VGTIISSGYGFICGAYMPISSFAEGLQNVIMFLPGTYGTSLVRNHAMRGAIAELESYGVADEAVKGLMDAMDCNLYFFENAVDTSVMYAVLGGTVALLIAVYIIMNAGRARAGK